MKKNGLTGIIIFAVFMSFCFINWVNMDKNKEEIKKVISEGYIRGLFKEVNLDLIEKYWHKECDTVGFNNGEIQKNNIGSRLKMAYDTGQKPPPVPNARHKTEFIDVTGYAAIAKVEIYFGDRHVFTDYINFYKFESGWKIVTKIWYEHSK